MGFPNSTNSAVLPPNASPDGKPDVPAEIRAKWQKRADLLAGITSVPAALITKFEAAEAEVLVASGRGDNPFHAGQRAERGARMFCDAVESSRARVHIFDARRDPEWRGSPDVALGLVSYLGLPLIWPDDELFGTLCIMDRRPREFTPAEEALIDELRESVETDLRLLYHLAHRRRAEAALRESEQRLRQIIEHMPVMMTAFDERGTITFWNRECERVTGYAADEIVGNPRAMEMLYPDPRYRERMLVEWHDRTNNYRAWEWDIACRDGSRRTIAWSDVSGHIRIPGWASWGIGVDVTNQKQTDDALRYRLDFEALVAALSNTFIDLPPEDVDAGIDRVLAELGRFVGVDRSYVYLFSEDGGRMTNTHEWCAEGIAPMRHRIQDAPAGSFPWFDRQIRAQQVVHVPSKSDLPPEAAAERREWDEQSICSLVCVPIVRHKAVIGFVGFESVRAEKTWAEDAIALLKIVGEMIGSALQHQRAVTSLRESQRALSTLMSNLPGMAYRCRNDRDWTMEFVSEGCFGLTGYQPSDLVGNRVVAYAYLVHPDDCESVWNEVQAAIRQRRPFTLSYRITTAQKQQKWVWEQGRGIFSHDGRLVALEGFILDVTEQKRADEVIADSERKLRQIIDLVPHFIFAKDRRGRFLLVNQAVADAYGTTVEELTGTAESVVNKSPEELEHFHSDDLEVMTGGKSKIILEETLVDAAGQTRVLTTTKIPFTVSGSAETAVLGVAVDITERKRAEEERARLEEQLRQAQKMEAIGTLASGVAHDFNNMITVILGGTELLKRKMGKTEGVTDVLEMIDRAVEQATGLTRSLLTFSRKVPVERKRIDVGEAVRSSVMLLRRALPATVELVTDIPAGEPIHVRADPTQLQQMLLNLAINARDAMPRGGTLRIALRGPEDTGRKSGDPGFARIIVSDTGVGIDPAIASRIFEPFFTTKPRGQGTGLGLALIDSTVKSHGGRVEVESKPGEGATFTVLLPCDIGEEAPAAVPKRGAVVSGGGETILLAEDNAEVRQLVESMLTSNGYEVLAVEDGLALMETCQRERDRIGLLVVDIDLPKRNGLDCLRILRTAGVDTPAIVITGTSDITVETSLPPGARLLRKPFHPDELLALAASLIAAPR